MATSPSDAEMARVCHLRLANQFLTTPAPGSVVALVAALGAVQAQDYAAAKWGLGQRLRGATDPGIERELTAGRILRTHVMRPTWHFVTPRDIRWMLALTAPRVNAAMASYNRKMEVTPAVLRRSNDAIAKALRGGKQLTRTELREVLSRERVGPVTTQRLGHLMMHAELDAVVCSGPRRGNQFTYALLDERIPLIPPIERDEALRTLTIRYFTTRGPATPRDFSWWSGLTAADARRGIEIAGKRLQRVVIGEQTYWMGARSVAIPRKSSAYLLPNYDEYFIGFRDRSAIARRLGRVDLVTGGNFLITHVIVVDGQLVGGWTRVLEKGGVTITARLLARVSPAERRSIAAAADAHGEFLGVPVTLSFT